MIYSIWAGDSITLTSGYGPPMFADGTPQDPAARRVKVFAAMTWDEAREIANKALS